MKNQLNAFGAMGHIDVRPNSRSISTGTIVLTVDTRTHLLDQFDGMVVEFMQRTPKLCDDIRACFDCHIAGQFDPPAFDKTCVGVDRDAANARQYRKNAQLLPT